MGTPLAGGGAITARGASPTNAAVILSSGGSSATVPTNVQIILQGANAQGQNESGGNSVNYTITEPNYQTIGWQGVSGASSYNIYRSTTTTPGSNGAYTLVASVSASTAASSYSTYVANSTYESALNFYNIAPGINCVWQDTSATNCVSGTVGPTSGYYYGPTNGYTYTVTAVVGGVESAQSSPSILPLFVNGVPVMIENIFNNTSNVTFSSSNPGGLLTPLGFSNSIYVALPVYPGPEYINPYTGSACPEYQVSVTGFNYFNLNIYTTQSWGSTDFEYGTEIDGDLSIYADSNAYLQSAPVPNQWNNIKIPLSSFLMSQSGSATASSTQGIQQTSYYKTTLANNSSNELEFYMETYFSVD